MNYIRPVSKGICISFISESENFYPTMDEVIDKLIELKHKSWIQNNTVEEKKHLIKITSVKKVNNFIKNQL